MNNDIYTILIADHNPVIRQYLSKILSKEKCVVRTAEDGEAALKAAIEYIPDVILLDAVMPKMDGIAASKRLKENPRFGFIYIIMLIDASGGEEGTILAESEADQFLVKPFQIETLVAAVRNGIYMSRDRRTAIIDPLTSLFNERIFEMILIQEKVRFKRFGIPLSLILLNIDHLEAANHTYGNQIGDMIVQIAADILRKSIRGFDLPACWEKINMALILPETDQEGAAALAERLRIKIEEYAFPQIGHVTASFGVATMTGMEIDLMETAKEFLQQAKTRGRNCVVSG